jgi:hypothetical protein
MPHLVLAGIVLIAAVMVARHGLRIHGMVFYDEKFSVEGARFLQEDLGHLLDPKGYAGRGIERLMAVLLLPVVALIPATADQFVVGHVLVALVYGLLAVPVYALARGLELSPRWALAAAAMAVFVPWAVFGTIFVNTALAATTAMAALWAMWRATVFPSVRADGLAVALLGLTGLARVSHLGLGAAWVLAIVVQAWRDAPPGESRRRTLSRLPRFIATSHPVLLAMAGAIVAVLLVKGVDAVVGGYPARIDFPLAALWQRLEVMTAHASSGMAFVAFIVGAAWLMRTLVAPRDRRTGAFAVLATGAFLSLLYVNHLGGLDERYGMPVIAPLFVAFAAALARREVGLLGPLAVGVLAWLCVDRWALVGHDSPFDYFDAPASQRLSVAWVPRISDVLAVDRHLAVALLLVAATAVAVALGRFTGAAARRLAALSIAATVLAGVSGANYLMTRLPAGYRPSASFSELTFVDDATGGKRASPLVEPGRRDQRLRNMWIELQFFNRSIDRPLSVEGNAWTLCCLTRGYPQIADIDEEGGGVTVRHGRVPPYVLTTSGWRRVGLVTTRVGSGLARPRIHVERVTQPPRLAWVARGTTPSGWVRPGRRAVVRVFDAAAPPRGAACLRLTLRGASAPAPPARWRAGRYRGVASRVTPRRLDLPLPAAARGRTWSEVAVSAGKRGGAVGLGDLRVVVCGAAEATADQAS